MIKQQIPFYEINVECTCSECEETVEFYITELLDIGIPNCPNCKTIMELNLDYVLREITPKI